jgi:hypothetical protein
MTMKIGAKMAFILRVYQMTDAENAEDIERDRELMRAGLMSATEFSKRGCTRNVARKIRLRDNHGGTEWPRATRKGSPVSIGGVYGQRTDVDAGGRLHQGKTKH